MEGFANQQLYASALVSIKTELSLYILKYVYTDKTLEFEYANSLSSTTLNLKQRAIKASLRSIGT